MTESDLDQMRDSITRIRLIDGVLRVGPKADTVDLVHSSIDGNMGMLWGTFPSAVIEDALECYRYTLSYYLSEMGYIGPEAEAWKPEGER